MNQLCLFSCLPLVWGIILGAQRTESLEDVGDLCRILEQTRSPKRAGEILLKIGLPQSDPGLGPERSKQAWKYVGRGRQWLDWWLISRQSSGRVRGVAQLGYWENLAEAEKDEVRRRPELVEQIARTRIFESAIKRGKPVDLSYIRKWWLDTEKEILEERVEDIERSFYGEQESGGRFRFHAHLVNRLRIVTWLFRKEATPELIDEYNWKTRYGELLEWMEYNVRYLRFDTGVHRFVIDKKAQTLRLVVAQDQQVVPIAEKPWPEWQGAGPVACSQTPATQEASDSPQQR